MDTNNSKIKILITGTAGFIGFHLANKLLESGYSVDGYDSINDYYDVNLKFDRLKDAGIKRENAERWGEWVQSSKYNNYRFMRGALEDKETLMNLFKENKYDYVINLAAQAGVRYSLENPQKYIDSNITGFLNILEACRAYPVKHLFYASSSSVYGSNKEMPFRTSHKTDSPMSLYAASKKTNELMAFSYNNLFNVSSTGLRFFTVYGPWGRPDMALFLFAKGIIEDEVINVFNDGKMERDFTYVDDIVEAIYLLFEKRMGEPDKKCAEIYNIGNNSPVKLMDFISSIESKLNKKAKINYLPMQPGDIPKSWADVEELYEIINFKPGINVTTGIGNFIEWYLNYFGTNER